MTPVAHDADRVAAYLLRSLFEIVQATVRCISRPDGSVPDTEDEADNIAIVARAY